MKFPLATPLAVVAALSGAPGVAQAGNPRAPLDSVMSRPAAVADVLSGVGDCVDGIKAGPSGQATLFAKAGWNILVPAGAQGGPASYVRRNVILLVTANGATVSGSCRLLARTSDRSMVAAVKAASASRYGVAPLTSASRFLKRNPNLPAGTRQSYLENRDVILRIKGEDEGAGPAGFINIVVAPNV